MVEPATTVARRRDLPRREGGLRRRQIRLQHRGQEGRCLRRVGGDLEINGVGSGAGRGDPTGRPWRRASGGRGPEACCSTAGAIVAAGLLGPVAWPANYGAAEAWKAWKRLTSPLRVAAM